MIDDELEKLQQEFFETFSNINIEENSSEEANLKEEFEKMFNNIPEQSNNPSINKNKKNIEAEDIKEVYVSDIDGIISKIFISQKEIEYDYLIYDLKFDNNYGVHINEPVYINKSDCMTVFDADEKLFSNGPITYENFEFNCSYQYTHLKNPNYKFNFEFGNSVHKDIVFNNIDNLVYKNEEQLNEYGFELKNGVVVSKKNINSIESFKNYKNYDIIIKCLDDIYKDLWDFVPTSILKNYNVPDTNLEFHLLIRFPEIKITNSLEKEHTIKELYVAVPLKIKNKEIYLNGDLYGMRAYFSEKEYLVSYKHSHLPTSNSFFSFGRFCLGSGQIIISINNLKENLDDISFFSFLVNLKYYLTWESLEGVPHIKMSKLDNIGTEISNNFNYSEPEFFQKFDFKITNITPIISNDLIDYDFNELEEKLTEWVIKNRSDRLARYLVNKDFDTGKYYNSSETDQRNRLSSDIKSSSNIIFKDSVIQGLVEKEKISNDTSNTKKVIHPNYTNYVKREWVKRINDYHVYFKRNKKIGETYGLS